MADVTPPWGSYLFSPGPKARLSRADDPETPPTTVKEKGAKALRGSGQTAPGACTSPEQLEDSNAGPPSPRSPPALPSPKDSPFSIDVSAVENFARPPPSAPASAAAAVLGREGQRADKSWLSGMMFVHEGNLESSCSFINDSLRQYGLPGPIELPARSSEHAARVANVLHLLLRQRHEAECRTAEDAHGTRNLHFDLNVARNQNAKLKEELRLREEECKRLLKDAQEAAAKAKSERTRLLKERDAAQSERNDLKRRDAHLTHQSRKLEQEHDKLKNRLLSLLGKSDSRSVPAHARQGIDATAPLRGKAPSSIPGRVGHSSAATQFVNSKVVRGHEEREGALLAENANLRQALALLSQELMDTINGCDAANRHGQPMAQSMGHVLQTDGADAEGWHRQLEMPFDIVQSDIQLALRDKLHALRLRIQQSHSMDSGRGAGGDEDIERLKGELADARRALKEQERLVEAYLHQASYTQPLIWDQPSQAATEGARGARQPKGVDVISEVSFHLAAPESVGEQGRGGQEDSTFPMHTPPSAGTGWDRTDGRQRWGADEGSSQFPFDILPSRNWTPPAVSANEAMHSALTPQPRASGGPRVGGAGRMLEFSPIHKTHSPIPKAYCRDVTP